MLNVSGLTLAEFESLDYAEVEAAEIAAKIIDLQKQEAEIYTMSLALINTKKGWPVKQKGLKLLKDTVFNLRNCVSPRKSSAPDIFDVMKSQAPKARKKRGN